MGAIKDIARQAHKSAVRRGKAAAGKNISMYVSDIINEALEVLDADKAGVVPAATGGGEFIVEFERDTKDGIGDELADVILVAMTTAEAMGVDIEAHVVAKIKYNNLRKR